MTTDSEGRGGQRPALADPLLPLGRASSAVEVGGSSADGLGGRISAEFPSIGRSGGPAKASLQADAKDLRPQGRDAEEQRPAVPLTVSRETNGGDHRVQVDADRQRALLTRPFPKPTHTRIMTVANQKGGVGKTTTAVNIAAALAEAGLRVLVIDTDPQGNASTALGVPHHSEVASIYDVLVDDVPLHEVVQPCPDLPGLFCAPATIDLAGAEIELVSLPDREGRAKQAIARYAEWLASQGQPPLDYVLIDCPPSLGLLTVNAFAAAREVLIPIQCEYYALEGLSQLLKNIELIKTHLNPALHVSTILLTMFDARTRLAAQVAAEVRRHFAVQVLAATIPRSVRVSEAPSHGQTVISYARSSAGAVSYLEAASEIAARGAVMNPPNEGTKV